MASKIPTDYKYNGLNYQQWQAEGRAYYVENGDIKGWKNRYWIRPDGEQIELYSTKRGSGPKKTPDDVLAVGGHMKPRKTSVRTNFVGNRKALEEVPERLRERFDSDEAFEEYKKYVKSGNATNQKLSSQAGELGTKFNKGHIVAVGAGGSHDPMAQRLESEAGNKSSQNVGEIPPDRLAATGTPRNWDEAVTMYQNPDNVPTELTPQDKQRIWQGEDPDIVYGQRQSQIDANPLARPNPNRVAKLQPGLNVKGGVVNFSTKGLIGRGLARAALPSVIGGAASLALGAGDVQAREERAQQDPSFINKFQAGLARTEQAADVAGMVPGPQTTVAEPVGFGAGLTNVAIDIARDPMGTLKAVGGGLKYLANEYVLRGAVTAP
jgi:hypothetical protein